MKQRKVHFAKSSHQNNWFTHNSHTKISSRSHSTQVQTGEKVILACKSALGRPFANRQSEKNKFHLLGKHEDSPRTETKKAPPICRNSTFRREDHCWDFQADFSPQIQSAFQSLQADKTTYAYTSPTELPGQGNQLQLLTRHQSLLARDTSHYQPEILAITSQRYQSLLARDTSHYQPEPLVTLA